MCCRQRFHRFSQHGSQHCHTGAEQRLRPQSGARETGTECGSPAKPSSAGRRCEASPHGFCLHENTGGMQRGHAWVRTRRHGAPGAWRLQRPDEQHLDEQHRVLLQLKDIPEGILLPPEPPVSSPRMNLLRCPSAHLCTRAKQEHEPWWHLALGQWQRLGGSQRGEK